MLAAILLASFSKIVIPIKSTWKQLGSTDSSMLNNVLELFQTYKKTGICSKLVLETMGGALTADLSVQFPTSPGWSSSSGTTRRTETKRSRRSTPSRRKRNQARRELWLAKKMAKNHEDILDNDNVEEKEEKHDEPVTESSDGGATSEHPRQIIYVMEESGDVANDDQDNVIEQIDGNAESETIASYDLTISALDADDAYLNIEENLLTAKRILYNILLK